MGSDGGICMQKLLPLDFRTLFFVCSPENDTTFSKIGFVLSSPTQLDKSPVSDGTNSVDTPHFFT